MGFNISQWRENVMNAVVDTAERRLRQTESLWLRRLIEAVDYAQFMGSRFMKYRTWNYAASVVGILFYNGKVLGVETDGAHFVTTTKHGSKNRAVWGNPFVKKNPVYGFDLNGKGDRPWKYAVAQNMARKTGRDYAVYAAREAKKILKVKKGYEIVLTVGMPYAWFERGNMRYRTINLIEDAVNSYLGKGKSAIRMIGIEVGTTTY